VGSVLKYLAGRLIFGAPGIRVQSLVQRCIGGPRETSIALHGRSFHCSTAHKYYWYGARYEPDMLRLLIQHLTPGAVLFDIGAHFGFWEVMLADRCSRIVALEPSPANFRRLSKNVAGLDNVVSLNVAASDRSGMLPFSENGSMSRSGQGDLMVLTEPVDALAEQYGYPTVIKIDVEGFATHIVPGMSSVLARRPTIIAEIHNAAEREALALPGYSAPEVMSRYPYHAVLLPG
jgi:FkbM family methyltransferase